MAVKTTKVSEAKFKLGKVATPKAFKGPKVSARAGAIKTTSVKVTVPKRVANSAPKAIKSIGTASHGSLTHTKTPR